MKKIYLAAAGLFFALLLLGTPALYLADRAGIYEVKNLGNVTAEAEYYDEMPAEGLLNRLVDLKNSLTSLYTDCLPGYYETVLTCNQVEDALNRPFTTLYSEARAKAAAKDQPGTPTGSAVDTLALPESADETEPAEGTAAVSEPAAESAPAAETETKPEPAPAAETETKPEPAPAAETETKPEPAPAAETETKPEPAPAAETETKPEPAPAAETETKPEPAPAAETETKPESTPAAEPKPAPEPADDRQKLVSVSSEFIGADGVHRHYRVKTEFADGMKAEFLDTAVQLTDQEKQARVKVQAKKLNRIADCNTDVNFYFMMFTRMQDTDFFEDVIAGEDSTKEYADLFFSLLSDNITAQRWEMNSVRDRVENVYLTDHHWNTYGSYLGFCQICKMICPDFTPVELGEAIDFPKSRFYGSFARSCMTLDLWDVFRVYDYDLGPYTCSPKWKFELQTKVLSKAEYTTPDRNIYAIFFPEVYEVHYTENRTGRNLLVLGDSYTQGFVELLASAFDNTYAYYYGNYSGLHYDTFIREHGITDVLFEQFSDRILFDLYGDDKLANIKTD